MKFIQITTCSEAKHRSNVLWRSSRFRFSYWWCQSFLIGGKSIYCGFRSTQDRHVRSVAKYAVDDLPLRKYWSSDVMVNFGIDFFKFVKETMAAVDCPDTVYKFSYDLTVNSNITYQIFRGNNELSFLPRTYIDFIDNL